MNLPDLTFTHASAPTFRATILPASLARLEAWFAKSPKQMIRAAMLNRGALGGRRGNAPSDYKTDPVVAMRKGLQDWRENAWPITRGGCGPGAQRVSHGHYMKGRRETVDHWKTSSGVGVETLRALSRLSLVEMLRACPANDVPIISYAWAYATARDGLNVFSDDAVCNYCDGWGLIETDNNGPIVNCPVCVDPPRKAA